MTTNWTDRKITREDITFYQWLEAWLTHPTQRDHVKRAKSPSFKRKMKITVPEHLEVKGVKCGGDFENPITGQQYKTGDQIKTDGHTRGEYYANLPEKEHPSELHVSWFYVYSYDELIEAYSWYDSASSVEKANDRVDGAVRAVLQPQKKYLTDDKLRKVTPIEYAAALCYPSEFRRGETSTHRSIVTQVNYFQDALLWLQEVVQSLNFGKSIPFTAPLASCYIASYLKYEDEPEKLEKLQEFIIQVSNNGANYRQKPMDCVSLFLREWTDDNSERRGRGVLNMKPASEKMQGFILLMIDRWIEGVTYQKCPDNWRTYYKTWQNEFLNKNDYNNALQQAFNIA